MTYMAWNTDIWKVASSLMNLHNFSTQHQKWSGGQLGRELFLCTDVKKNRRQQMKPTICGKLMRFSSPHPPTLISALKVWNPSTQKPDARDMLYEAKLHRWTTTPWHFNLPTWEGRRDLTLSFWQKDGTDHLFLINKGKEIWWKGTNWFQTVQTPETSRIFLNKNRS